jgi:hypothetical protein
MYNASAVKIYNATNSLVRFENKDVFFYFEKRSSLLKTGVVVVKLEVAGLPPDVYRSLPDFRVRPGTSRRGR